jgi:transposase-like protein
MPTDKDTVSSVPDDIQRWTAGRKAAVVLDLIKGKSTPADVARQHALTIAEVETWLERFTEGGKEFLRAVPRDTESRFEAEKKDLHAHCMVAIGEQALQIDALKKASRILEGQRQTS